jgi:hypothetical protein
MNNEKKLKQFLRIAHATLRTRYPFKPQRSAYIAKMWVRYQERERERFTRWVFTKLKK